jgi:hypothetical protein
MVNPHLTATGAPWMGSSTPTTSRPASMPSMLTWTGGGQGSGSTLRTSSGNLMEDTNENVVLSSDNLINQDVTPQTQEELQAIQQGIQDDKVKALAELEASNPKYWDSYEGQLMRDAGYKPGDPEWTAKFGLGHIVATNTGEWKKNEQGEWKFIAPEGMRSSTTGDYLYSGAGKYILDKGDITGSEGYKQAKGEYWKTRTEQEQFEEQQRQQQTGYDDDPGGGGVYAGGYPGGPGGWIDVKRFSRGRPENISPWARNIAGTPMLPVAGSGAGGSLAAADELYALASGKKAFSMTPEEQGILALLNA